MSSFILYIAYNTNLLRNIMQKRKFYILTVILLVTVLSACNMPNGSPSSAEQTAIIDRSVAETVTAGSTLTLEPGAPAVSDTPDPAGEEITPTATNTPEADTPTPSNTPIPCNMGRFVKDVTILDGTIFEPGVVFTKTWRLKNTGSCAWTSGYDIVFSGGDAMDAPSAIQITSGTVNPGQNVDVSVDLTAPASEGTYRGNWQLRDPSDVIFEIENSSSDFFWVEIEVEEPAPDPVTATLHTSSQSKYMSVGGRSSGTIAGIAPNGDALRAFVDFDLSTLAGLDSGSTIQNATLDVSDHDGFSCFEFLHPLKAGQINFGSTPQYPADFNEVPSAILFSVPSALGISAPVSITGILQNYVSSNGAGHFQFRIWLDGDNAGAGLACMMEWADPLLNITYLP
jgi:hypothetical protein